MTAGSLTHVTALIIYTVAVKLEHRLGVRSLSTIYKRVGTPYTMLYHRMLMLLSKLSSTPICVPETTPRQDASTLHITLD